MYNLANPRQRGIKVDPKEKRQNQRNLIEKYLDGPVEFLIRHNVSPNLISYLGFLCAIASAVFIGLGFTHYPLYLAWISPFLLFISGALDTFDGEVARRTGKDSKSGAFLDSNLDRLSDSAIIFGMIFSGLIDYIMGFVILFLNIMISYSRSKAENEEVNMKGVGIMERAERLLFIMALLSIETWVNFLSTLFLGSPIKIIFLVLIWIYIGLLILTIMQRFIHTFRTLRALDKRAPSNPAPA
ncbi:MAG: hypothetical protein GF353_22230 [Candidatus Lokiarchaeota archaeon]|nr:hypothetical protein [Candidatus Lokiarchaeota archaeon]